MIKLILITIAIVGLAFAGFAIKMFIKKDGEFKKGCGSVDPKTGKSMSCSCHDKPDQTCDNEGEK